MRLPQWIWASAGGAMLAFVALFTFEKRQWRALFSSLPEGLYIWLVFLLIRSVHGDAGRSLAVIAVATGAVAGVLVLMYSGCAPEKKGVFRLVLLLMVLHATFGVLQMAGFDPLFQQRHVVGLEPDLPAGFTGHHTFFGLLMALCAWYWLQQRLWVAFGISVVFVLLTKSAFSLLALAAGLMWFAWCRGWRRSVAFASLILAWLGFYLFVVSEPGSFFFHNGRLPVWVYTVNAIREAPWLGYGVAEFSREFPAYHQVLIDKRWEEAHNELLEYVFNTGLVGLIAMLPFLIAVLKRLWMLPKSREKELFAGILLMIGVNAMGSFPLQIAPFAALAIYSVAWVLRPLPEDTPPDLAGRP